MNGFRHLVRDRDLRKRKTMATSFLLVDRYVGATCIPHAKKLVCRRQILLFSNLIFDQLVFKLYIVLTVVIKSAIIQNEYKTILELAIQLVFTLSLTRGQGDCLAEPGC